MKKLLLSAIFASFVFANVGPVFAASDLMDWLAQPDNAELKKKFDALPKDKQAQIEKDYVACKKDVDEGKLPKGTCKPRVKEALSK